VDIVLLRRRAALEILLFISLVTLSALFLKPVAAYMGGKMGVWRDSLILRAESVLNRKIRYASANPSIFGSLDIREISVSGNGEEPLLQLDQFALGFSVLDLLTGKKEAAIRSITLEGLSIVYDVDGDRDILELFTRAAAKDKNTALPSNSAERFVLPPDCVLRIRNSSLILKKAGKSLRVTGLSFDGEVKDGRFSLNGNWHTEAVIEGLTGKLKSVTVDGGLEGGFARDFSEGSLVLSVSAFRADTFELGNLRFDVSIRDNIAELKNSGGPFDLSLAYGFDSGRISGEFRAFNFTCAEILSFTGAWKRYKYWLDLAFTGTASFNAGAGEGLRYRFDMKGRGTPEIVSGFDIAGSGTGGEVVFERCYLDFNRGTVDYRGDLRFNPLIPNGVLVLSGFTLTGNSGISGEFRLVRSGKNLELTAKDISVGAARFSGVSGGMNWEKAGFSCGFGLTRAGTGGDFSDGAEPASLSLNGSYTSASVNENTGPQLQGNLSLNNFSLADIRTVLEPLYGTETIPPLLWAGNLAITAECFISTDFTHITYSVPRYLVAYKGLSDISAEGSLSGADRRFEILGGRLNWKNGSADISLMADFSDLNDISLQIQAAYNDFTYYFEGVFFDRQTLSIRGSYGVSVYVSAVSPGGYSGYVKLDSVPVPFRGGTARLGVDMSIRYDSLSFWSLDINRLELLENENPAAPFVIFSAAGQADQDGLRIASLSYRDKFGELAGTINANWEHDFSQVEGALVLNGPNGENCTVKAAYYKNGGALPAAETGGAVFDAQFSGMYLERFAAGGRNGRFSGTAAGVWNRLDSYSFNINLESLEIPGGTMPVLLAASASLSPDRIDISATDLKIGRLIAPECTLSIDRPQARLEMRGLLDGDLNGKPVGVDASLNVDFAPIDNWFGAGKALDTLSGSLDIREARIRDKALEEPCSFRFSLTYNDEGGLAFNLSGGPGDMLRFEILEDGSLYADLSAPSPVQGSLNGTFRNFNIDAAATGIYIDLPSVWAMIPIDETVVFTGGFITGETRITGSLWDPEFNGDAWGTGVCLTLPDYVNEEIGPSSGAIRLDGNEVSFGPIKGRCGNGSGEVTAVFRFNRWVPSFDMTITVAEQEAIPFDFGIVGVYASGSASGILRLNLEDSEVLTITGTVSTENTQITLNADELQAVRDHSRPPGSIEIVANVHLNAGRRVEFLWPNENLPIIRAYGAAGSGITIISDTRVPTVTLNGDISLLGGEIYYFQRSFFIREGEIYFSQNDPQIDPYISTRAEIRDRTSDGPVTISMIVDNSPLSRLSPRFESSPSLSQLEIYSLLGQIPAEGQQSEALVRLMPDLLAQFIPIRQVERGIRDILGLDMFTVRTQVLQNALLMALNTNNSGTGATAADAANPDYRPEQAKNSNQLGNYFDNTAVYMGKYLAPDLFAQATIAMRYDQNREAYGGLRFEPDIGLDLRSPFGDIRWKLSPRNIESVTIQDMIKDQSFSLVWRWSF
jgi:hypothetical protein